MTQVSETIRKRSGGEGGIARGPGRPLVLRFAPDRRGWAATSKNRSAIFVEPSGFVHTPCSVKIKSPRTGLFIFTDGGEGGIRTHVPELPDHPISSRRRYDHFGTSPFPFRGPGKGPHFSGVVF